MNKLFYPTPSNIVESIFSHEVSSLENITTVLEPAVGKGALLPALKGKEFSKLLAIDIDASNILHVKKNHGGSKNKYSYENFLEADLNEKFSLIITNPPFNSKLKSWVTFEAKKMPIESAFLKKCLSLLAPNGTIVSVLPASIIKGEKSLLLRKSLMESFELRSIRKLPQYSFGNVEGAFYVCTIRNSRPSKESITTLHDKDGSVQVKSMSELEIDGYCFDPETLRNKKKYLSFLKSFGKGTSLSVVALIERGTQKNKTPGVLSTTDFKQLYAAPDGSNLTRTTLKDRTLSTGCIVVKRVSRNAAESFSIFLGGEKCSYSETVLSIKPIHFSIKNSIALMLKLRISSKLGGRFFFEHNGSGACYISKKELENFLLPALPLFSDEDLSLYEKHVLERNSAAATEIEEAILQNIELAHGKPE